MERNRERHKDTHTERERASERGGKNEKVKENSTRKKLEV